MKVVVSVGWDVDRYVAVEIYGSIFVEVNIHLWLTIHQ